MNDLQLEKKTRCNNIITAEVTPAETISLKKYAVPPHLVNLVLCTV